MTRPEPAAARALPLPGLLRPFPTVTASILAVTVAVSLVGVFVPGVLDALERRPAALHGEWWRWLTSLLVQDGGAYGLLFNSIGLLLMALPFEKRCGGGRLLALYLASGLLGQAVGQLWQPVGGGNSVAFLGLLGGLLSLGVRGGSLAPLVCVMYGLWLLFTLLGLKGPLWPTLAAVLFAVGLVLAFFRAPWPVFAWAAAICGAGLALALSVAHNIHGPPVLFGLTVGALWPLRKATRAAHG